MAEMRKRKDVKKQETDEKEVNIETIQQYPRQRGLESFMDTYFPNKSLTFKKFLVRLILTLILLVILPMLVFGDFLVFYTIIFIIVSQCYREYVRVGYQEYRVHEIPLIQSLAYYMLFGSTMYLIGEFPIEYLSSVLPQNVWMILSTYHKFGCFIIFMIGIVISVLSLKKHHYKMQFILYGWCLIGAVFFILSSRCIFRNLQLGIMWAILPMSLIVTNDIFAYLIGTYIGRTRLIKLSPKKTWEGFIGAFFVTMITSVIMTQIITKYPYFYCPYVFQYQKHTLDITCKRPNFMELHTFQFPIAATMILPDRISSISYYPIYIHVLIIAIFTSLLAPFGGFFASGFKRAFKIKDFGDTFPGHGGMLDRMDCQILIPIFVYVYTNTFVRSGKLQSIVESILKLEPDQQLELFDHLKNALVNTGIIEP